MPPILTPISQKDMKDNHHYAHWHSKQTQPQIVDHPRSPIKKNRQHIQYQIHKNITPQPLNLQAQSYADEHCESLTAL